MIIDRETCPICKENKAHDCYTISGTSQRYGPNGGTFGVPTCMKCHDSLRDHALYLSELKSLQTLVDQRDTDKFINTLYEDEYSQKLLHEEIIPDWISMHVRKVDNPADKPSNSIPRKAVYQPREAKN